MRTDLTDITLIVDRSGSMDEIKSDAEGGVNSFIASQAADSGETLLTLIEFDTEYNFVTKGTPIQDVEKYNLVPRGMTALLDATGRGINETGERLSQMPESERPGLVIFAIMTDGKENSSKEFELSQIKNMIETQQKDYNWQFIFLGADEDAFGDAASMGIQAASVLRYAKENVTGSYASLNSNVSRMRAQVATGQSLCNEFTDEERDGAI